MPLYRRRVKQSFCSQPSQATSNTQDNLEPKAKIMRISGKFDQPSSSQNAVEETLQHKGKMDSPVCPEVLQRTASEPNETAFMEYNDFEKIRKADGKTDDYKMHPELDIKNMDIEDTTKYTELTAVIGNSASDIAEEPSLQQYGENELSNLFHAPRNVETASEFAFPDKITTKEKQIVPQKKTSTKKKSSEIVPMEMPKNSASKSQKKVRKVQKKKESANSKEDTLCDSGYENSLHSKESEYFNSSSEKFGDSSNSQTKMMNDVLNDSNTSSKNSQLSLNNFATKNKTNKKVSKNKESKNSQLEDVSIVFSQKSDISMNDPIIKTAYAEFRKKTEKFTRVATPRDVTHYEKMMWLQEQRNTEVYVHCDRCDKIRYLKEVNDPTELPDKWFCENNPDKLFNNCDIPEEEYPLHVQADWINNLYNAGSLVWARVDGYPWWPGIIDDDPNTESYYWLDNEMSCDPSYYHVTFFDKTEVTRAWLKPYSIRAFIKEMDNPVLMPGKYSIYKDRIDFAMKQAKEAAEMPLLDRLRKFSFLARYKKPIKNPKSVKELKNERKSKKIERKRFEKKINNGKKRMTKVEDTDDDNFSIGSLDDFDLPPNSPTIENISLELFE